MSPRRRGPKPASFSEIGVTGLKHSGGIVREEFLPALRGRQGVKVFKEMESNDPIVGAVLFAISMLIRGAEWKVIPGTDVDGTEVTKTPAVEFLGQCKDDMSHSWDVFITEALSMLTYGWSWFEIIYKRRDGDIHDPRGRSKFDDGKIGWRKFAIRAQDTLERWRFADDGNVTHLHQGATIGVDTARTVSIARSLLFRTSTFKNNPEGRSALRNAYRPYYFKTKIEEIEGIGVERDLAGLPMMTTPENLDIWNDKDENAVAQKTIAEDLIRSIRMDEQMGVLKPFGWELELLSTGGTRNFNTGDIIARYDQRIAMTMLADFIVLGHSNKFGSFALSRDKTSMFNSAIGGWLDMIRDVLNTHAVPRLFRINGMPLTNLPRFEHGPVDVPDLQVISEYINRLTEAGMPFFPNPELSRHLMRVARFPGKPPEGVDIVKQKQENVEADRDAERQSGQQIDGSNAGGGSSTNRDNRDRKTRSRTPTDTGGANPRGNDRR